MKKSRIYHPVLQCMVLFWLITIAWFPENLSAQTSSDSTKNQLWWLSSGVGRSTDGISFCFGYSVRHDRLGFYSFRFTCNQEMKISFNHRSTLDAGLLFGYLSRRSRRFFSVSGGIGLTGVVKPEVITYEVYRDVNKSIFISENKNRIFLTAGIPVEGQLFWTVSPSMGVGFYMFANLNLERSFCGILFSIRAGHLGK